MAEIYCGCKSCEIERNNLQKQLDHPFYKKVDDFRDEVKIEALTKASTKYEEPFNPRSWSVKQLGFHAMSENYDQGNYIVGLMDAAEDLEKKVKELELHLEDKERAYNSLLKDYEITKQEAEYWRLRALKEKEQSGTTTLFNDIKKALGENLDVQG